MTPGRPPLIVLDVGTWEDLAGPAEVLRGRGWDVVDRLDNPPLRVERLVCRALITDSATAQAAVLAASWGAGLLIGIGGVDQSIRERLIDDLERISPLQRRVAPADLELHPEAARLLDRLAAGQTLGEAAREAHLSRRTADRRLAEARRSLGVASTAEAITVWVSRREG